MLDPILGRTVFDRLLDRLYTSAPRARSLAITSSKSIPFDTALARSADAGLSHCETTTRAFSSAWHWRRRAGAFRPR